MEGVPAVLQGWSLFQSVVVYLQDEELQSVCAHSPTSWERVFVWCLVLSALPGPPACWWQVVVGFL